MHTISNTEHEQNVLELHKQIEDCNRQILLCDAKYYSQFNEWDFDWFCEVRDIATSDRIWLKTELNK